MISGWVRIQCCPGFYDCYDDPGIPVICAEYDSGPLFVRVRDAYWTRTPRSWSSHAWTTLGRVEELAGSRLGWTSCAAPLCLSLHAAVVARRSRSSATPGLVDRFESRKLGLGLSR
jgi:hypothetical protein